MIQLTLEQHRFELCGPHICGFFPMNIQFALSIHKCGTCRCGGSTMGPEHLRIVGSAVAPGSNPPWISSEGYISISERTSKSLKKSLNLSKSDKAISVLHHKQQVQVLWPLEQLFLY